MTQHLACVGRVSHYILWLSWLQCFPSAGWKCAPETSFPRREGRCGRHHGVTSFSASPASRTPHRMNNHIKEEGPSVMAIAPQRSEIGIRRHFTTEGVHPYDEVRWERRDARITN